MVAIGFIALGYMILKRSVLRDCCHFFLLICDNYFNPTPPCHLPETAGLLYKPPTALTAINKKLSTF